MQISRRNSLETKSSLLLLLLLSAVGFLLLMIENDTDALLDDVASAEKISRINVSVLDLNKTVEAMQRNVSVYGVSGSQAIFEKLIHNNQVIQSRLNNLSSQADDEHMKVIIDDLIGLTLRFEENLVVLPKRYQIKTEFANDILPLIYQRLDTKLTYTLYKAEQASDRAALLQASLLWTKANHAALLFLSSKEYSQRRNVEYHITRMESNLSQLSEAFVLENPEWFEDVKLDTQSYLDNFDKATQANRNYFALVNVVMAGDAVEFTTLVDKLTDYTADKFNTMQAQIAAFSADNKTLLIKAIVVVAVLCLLAAMAFHFYITGAIKSLANTFQSFIQGDFSAEVSGKNRADEIGLLAQAATEFRDVSLDLIKAKTEAENISRIKSEFLANMSHEIRTPMNGILGMTQTLMHSELTKRQQEMLAVINSSGKSLLTILNDILDLSKLEAHKVVLDSTPFSFAEICYELKNMFASVAA